MPEFIAEKKAFRSILVRAIVVPMLVMTLLAAGLIWQVGQLNSSRKWVEHTDLVVAHIYEFEKLFVDMQSGVRGFLLTGDESYLEPYTAGRDAEPAVQAEMAALVSDRPEAIREVREISDQYNAWSVYAEARIAARRRGETALPEHYGAGNNIMMDLRARFTKFLGEEEHLRDERNRLSQTTALITMWGAGLATVIAGIALAIVARTQLHVLAERYEAALAQARDLSTELERRVEERTAELSASNGQLAEANKELEAFSYSISHDLRAPMRHITGFADLLRRSLGERIAADDADNLAIIYNTAVLAGRMVDDLLAFCGVGRTQLRMAEVDVNALIKQCITELGPETRSRNIIWNVDTLRPTRGDAALLRMVFQNLISNAVKYTQKREESHIDITSRAESGGTTFVVRDNGVGFDMAYVHKLFGVFQRLHRSEDFEGTGIGLANVRRIIVRHGGQVWAEGMPDGGAAFYVHLPD